MDRLFIIIPAYNEAANIENVVRDWYPIVNAYNGDIECKLIIVDDGSSDDTKEIVRRLAIDYPLLELLSKVNGGHGSAVLFGYRYALENNADWIFQTDSDGQTNPDEFPKFWELHESYDAILGNRQSDRQDGQSRILVENILRLILKIIFKVNVPDANAPFRLMKSELVQKYIEKMPRDYNLPNVMFTTFFVFFKENIEFVKISFRPRQGGVNSINLKKIVKIGWKAMGDFYNLKREFFINVNGK